MLPTCVSIGLLRLQKRYHESRYKIIININNK